MWAASREKKGPLSCSSRKKKGLKISVVVIIKDSFNIWHQLSQAFFWYDTSHRRTSCNYKGCTLCCLHRLYFIVDVIPKAGLARLVPVKSSFWHDNGKDIIKEILRLLLAWHNSCKFSGKLTRLHFPAYSNKNPRNKVPEQRHASEVLFSDLPRLKISNQITLR